MKVRMVVDKIEIIEGEKYITCRSLDDEEAHHRFIRVPFTEDVGPHIEEMKSKSDRVRVYVDIEDDDKIVSYMAVA